MSDVVYEIAFPEGYNAGKLGHPRETNPYPTNSKEHSIWDSGWEAGYQETKNDEEQQNRDDESRAC